MAQARWVQSRLAERHPEIETELIVIRTKGDLMQHAPLAVIGGKGVFIKEIEEELLRKTVDIAVHSLKDVPAELPDGLEIAATPLREDPRDVLISKGNRKLEEMAPSSRIGTGSIRRGLQLKDRFPALEIVPIRGNLDTRMKKLAKEDLDGIIVAAAGLARMGWLAKVSEYLDVAVVIPAVGQGALGIEIRRDDERSRRIVACLNDPVTFIEVGAERAFLKRLGGGCQLPIAAFAKKDGAGIAVDGMVGSPDGKIVLREHLKGAADAYREIGERLAEAILRRGGDALLAEGVPHS